MRILFDQGAPVPLRRHLAEHQVDTAFERGWSRLRNSALLDRAEERGYRLLVTTDQSLRHDLGRRGSTGAPAESLGLTTMNGANSVDRLLMFKA